MIEDIRFPFVLTLVSVGSCGVAQEPAHVIVRPDNVTWGPASPKLPAGAQFARISGDASQPGEPYVFCARLPDGYRVPPHWQPMDEHVTVILRAHLGAARYGAAVDDFRNWLIVLRESWAHHQP